MKQENGKTHLITITSLVQTLRVVCLGPVAMQEDPLQPGRLRWPSVAPREYGIARPPCGCGWVGVCFTVGILEVSP